ncbi:MAG TPA: LysR family transcriptional regulator [Polyangia bacterium]|nr:LysR family transcriptional regulator [Polyangia bacterium]
MIATNGLDLNLVTVFLRVVETGSFTAAGAALGVPKSSASRAVGRLEEALGVRLLQRTTRRLTLTDAGQRYLAEVRGPLGRLAEASSEVADMGREPRGVVRVSTAPPVGEDLLVGLFSAFAREHARIRVELVVTSRRVNLVEENIDLAIRAGRLDDSSLIARKIAVTGIGLYAAPSYLERRAAPRQLAALAGHDVVIHSRAGGSSSSWRLQGPRGVERVDVEGQLAADDLGTVRLLALAGAGIAMLPDVVVRGDVERGALTRVLPSYGLRGEPIHLVSAPLRHVPLRVKLLRDFLLSEIPRRLAGTPCAVEEGRAGARAGRGRAERAARAAS